ncbi:MAG: methyltransferase domain-containing protein [Gammaproteobacteria bacterium]|nr:MAG: methyltransferase domain-containing protein [Gammaproteobacteria bacterium]
MSKIGELILYPLASFIYKRKLHINSELENVNADSAYWQWQKNSSDKLFKLYKGLDIKGKNVLDIGCGIGGRTCYLADQGPKKIVGIDINKDEIETAIELAKQNGYGDKVEFINVDGENSSFGMGSFDTIVLVDCMEHVESPLDLMSNSYEKLKAGGSFFFGTIGWYHHQATHMRRIVPVPFLSVFFSDKTILNVARKILSSSYYKPSHFDSDPPVKRWQGVMDLKDRPGEYLNKNTISSFRKLFQSSKFEKTTIIVHGFGASKKFLKPFNILAKAPYLNEIWHSYIVGVGVRKNK